MCGQLSTQSEIQRKLMCLVFLIVEPPRREGGGRNILQPRMYFAALNEIPHRFTTPHAKLDSI